MSRLSLTDDLEIWRRAAAFDPTLGAAPRLSSSLAMKRVSAEPFTRQLLFQRMADGDISLFTGLSVLPAKHAHSDPCRLLADTLRKSFPSAESVRVATGRRGLRRTVPVATLVDRWEDRRALISITDLHIRGTRLDGVIDTDVLSNFNILCRGSEDVAWHEMMTMVVSSEGIVTDSHSDDPDGSNHCFIGLKLWLVWETFEGRTKGLQDVERDYVPKRARFDMSTFLQLRSARWFVVSPGMTLFLPGDLTHKVVTLEPYLGVGSFYVSIPNCVRTISRWRLHGPLWSTRERESNTPALVGEIARTATTVIRRVRRMGPEAQKQWGLAFLDRSIRSWKRAVPAATREKLLQEPSFKALITEASA